MGVASAHRPSLCLHLPRAPLCPRPLPHWPPAPRPPSLHPLHPRARRRSARPAGCRRRPGHRRQPGDRERRRRGWLAGAGASSGAASCWQPCCAPEACLPAATRRPPCLALPAPRHTRPPSPNPSLAWNRRSLKRSGPATRPRRPCRRRLWKPTRSSPSLWPTCAARERGLPRHAPATNMPAARLCRHRSQQGPSVMLPAPLRPHPRVDAGLGADPRQRRPQPGDRRRRCRCARARRRGQRDPGLRCRAVPGRGLGRLRSRQQRARA